MHPPDLSKMPRPVSFYHCSHCGKGFTRKYNLKVHEEIHGERKQIKCTQCDKGFNRVSDVKRHIESAHLKIVIPCEFCGRAFFRKDILNRHVRECHKVTQCSPEEVKQDYQHLLDSFDLKMESSEDPFPYFQWYI